VLIFTGPSVMSEEPPLQQAILEAVGKVLPTLVNIQPVTETYRGGEKRRSTTIGSGVIISPDGYVLTNYHIAAQAKRVTCTLSDGLRLTAQVVGSDPATDIAVLKLNLKEHKGNTITWARLGDSDQVQMGEYVLAFGSPLALSRSTSLGIVSNPRRYLPGGVTLPTGERTGSLNLWIQTDAAINPGNSGGPLVNLEGEVIGVNARSTYAENIGFAIPINTVKEVLDTLMAGGTIRRSYIGIVCQPMGEFEQSFGSESKQGVLVGFVAANSPAAEAGLAPGDVLVEFDGRPLSARFSEDLPAVFKIFADTPIGKRARVVLRRQDKQEVAYLVTRERPKEVGEDLECPEWGFTVKELTEEMATRRRLRDDRGVLVTGIKSRGAADRSELLSTDSVIEFVQQQPVEDLAAFGRIYQQLKEEETSPVILKVRKGRDTLFVLLEVDYHQPSSPEPETAAPEEDS
jgi:serine protease Do